MENENAPDGELPAVTQDLLKVLDDVAENAIYSANPRVEIGRFAAAFAAYLRTPD